MSQNWKDKINKFFNLKTDLSQEVLPLEIITTGLSLLLSQKPGSKRPSRTLPLASGIRHLKSVNNGQSEFMGSRFDLMSQILVTKRGETLLLVL